LLFGAAERRVITALMVHRYGGCVEAAASWTRQKWIWWVAAIRYNNICVVKTVLSTR
jgi:cytochrome c-type biogenesis protein CcmH/NrfF